MAHKIRFSRMHVSQSQNVVDFFYDVIFEEFAHHSQPELARYTGDRKVKYTIDGNASRLFGMVELSDGQLIDFEIKVTARKV